MATTLKDIAKKLGISEATVSLALNNNSLVNEKTKKRVHEAAKELKYFPNMVAKGLATNKSNTIGIIVPDINIVFYANILRAIDEVVNRAGYSLLAAMSNNDPQIEEEIIRTFISKRIEGVLAVPTNKPTKFLTSYQKALREYNIPLVYITSLYTIDEIRYVMGDIREGTYMLIKHLTDLGHRNIVFIGGNRTVPTTSLRREGYSRALGEKGIPVFAENLIECEDIHYDQAALVTEELIGRRRDFTAICAMNDEMALGVINTCLLYTSLVLISDVTDIELSERVRRDFAANVSHELKTPLTSINGFAQLVANGMAADEESIREYAKRISEESDRLMGLINDTLMLSELEQISIDETIENVDIVKVTEDVLHLLEDNIVKRNLKVHVSGAAEMMANKNRIRELILNLCDNAIKYNKEDGSVDIRLSEQDAFVKIEVQDTGIGVPADEANRIFERFYRAKNSGGSTVSGTGLGLAIVKHIVALYEGELTLESRLGEGSRFTIRMKKD